MTELLVTLRLTVDMPEHKREKLAIALEEAATDWLDERGYDYRVTGAPVIQDIGDALPEDLGAARREDPDTAKVAAKVNYPRRKSNTYRLLMLYLSVGDEGWTASELEDETGIEYRTLTPRIGYLKRHGFIVSTEEKRQGNRGSAQEVKVLTEFGKRMIERHEKVTL